MGPDQRIDIHPPQIPIMSVPTSLSAGEYSNFAGATDDASKRKHSFQSPLKGPELVILDPQLTTTTPERIWLSTGVRAVDHCVETYVAVSDSTNEKTDTLALHALRLLVPSLLRCKHDPGDLEARLMCQLGSVDAMAACTSGKAVQLGASHGIGHQVGGLFFPLFPLMRIRSLFGVPFKSVRANRVQSSVPWASVTARRAAFSCQLCVNTMPPTMPTTNVRTDYVAS